MRCPYVQPEWFCEKEQGHDGPHEMYVGVLVTPSRTDRQPPTSATQSKGGQGASDA